MTFGLLHAYRAATFSSVSHVDGTANGGGKGSLTATDTLLVKSTFQGAKKKPASSIASGSCNVCAGLPQRHPLAGPVPAAGL